MSKPDAPARELTPKELEIQAAEVAVQVIAAAGQAMEEKHGETAGTAYRQVVTGMGKKLQELLEWKAKAEDKILEMAAAPPKPKVTHIEWIKIDDDMEAKKEGYYLADGDSDTQLLYMDEDNNFRKRFEKCGGRIHIAGPLKIPN